ncbi:MAG: HEAT repeat domain-containing protein [FCB group bacterium]|nr:HEAT repeat domain-containing protein [FCB group bacterium]
MNCEQYQELIYLEKYGEISERAQRAAAKHIETCPVCAEAKVRIEKVFECLESVEMPQADPEWLKGARNELIAHLEATRKRNFVISVDWNALRRFFSIPALRPVYAAMVLIGGILIGRFAFAPQNGFIQQMPYQTSASPQLDIRGFLQDGNLHNIAFQQLSDQEVAVSFDAYQKVQLQGTPQNQDIQEILAYIMLTNPNGGMRIRTMKTLGNQPDSLVKHVMIYSLLHDENPGVRLKAIHMLKNYPPSANLRDALLKVLMTDDNPAVRIEAVEALSKIIQEKRVREVLRIAAAKDSNEYIQLLAKNALAAEKSTIGTAIEDLKNR